jgi:glyoxylase-like metal-dependent hydrolase (beta-lactamase superfamily II)
MSFVEIADRVWVSRQEWFDLNITAIGGESGLVVVDTHASSAAARTVIDDLRALDAGDVVAVVNTHWHFDHTFGNAAFREAYGAELPIHATESAARMTVAGGR